MDILFPTIKIFTCKIRSEVGSQRDGFSSNISHINEKK